jgi:hypothetical protein
MAHAIVCILDPMDVIGWGLGVTWDRFVMCLRGHYENGDHELWEFAHFAKHHAMTTILLYHMQSIFFRLV